MSVAELEADMQELLILQEKATRANVKTYFGDVLANVKEQKERAVQMQPQPMDTVAKDDKPQDAVKYWETIAQYSVELGLPADRFIEVSFRFKGIDQLPSKNVSCEFTESSFDLKIVGYEGKNYRLVVSNLFDDISTQLSTFRVKKNHVIVDMCKKSLSGGFWANLHATKPRVAQDDDTIDAKEKNKNAIQEMYEDGDDEVKKMIAERINLARASGLDKFGA
eukprot:GEMP01020092.1.p1 GENE.GEMP01020092.1~~GEMP01020092.1.p1  ORF type:complete len:222 (-),score=64.58 GEMP01020092.1:1856-2521(-)